MMRRNESYRVSALALKALFPERLECVSGGQLPSVAFNWSFNGIVRTEVVPQPESNLMESLTAWMDVCKLCGVRAVLIISECETSEFQDFCNLKGSESIMFQIVEELGGEYPDAASLGELTLQDKLLFPDYSIVETFLRLEYSSSHDIWALGVHEPFWVAYGKAITKWGARISSSPVDQFRWHECFPGVELIGRSGDLGLVPKKFIDSLRVDPSVGEVILGAGSTSKRYGGFFGSKEIRIYRDLPFIFDVVTSDGSVQPYGRLPGCRLDLDQMANQEVLQRFKEYWQLRSRAFNVVFSGPVGSSVRIQLMPRDTKALTSSLTSVSGALTIDPEQGVEIEIVELGGDLVGRVCTVGLPGVRRANGDTYEIDQVIEDDLCGMGTLTVNFAENSFTVISEIDAERQPIVALRFSGIEAISIDLFPVAPAST